MTFHQRLGVFLALSVVTAALAGVFAVTARPQGSVPDAGPFLEAYNRRPIGAFGWRRVRMELRNEQVTTRAYTIVQLWRRQVNEIRSVVFVEHPAGLRGTSYLLSEGDDLADGMELFLFLPAGNRRVLTIRPHRYGEALLGSDFSYRDLLWTLPSVGLDARVTGDAQMLGRQVTIVDVEPSGSSAREIATWDRARYYISGNPWILLGVDYFRGNVATRRLRIEELKQVQGVWTPTRIVMSSDSPRSSVLTLEDFSIPESGVTADLFVDSALPRIGESVLSGTWQRLFEVRQ